MLYDQDRGWEEMVSPSKWDWTGFAMGLYYRQRGRMEFLSDVFVHEFAHIVSLKAYLPWSEERPVLQWRPIEDEEWLNDGA